MTVTATTTTSTQALRRAAVRATLAPSVHNTQPWRFVLTGDALEVHADPIRRLPVLDPTGRQMLISCGCAVFNARVSLAASGFHATVERMPDPVRPNLIARVTAHLGSPGVDPDLQGLAALDASIDTRRTNRRQFAAEAVPESVVDLLVAAAAAEGATLMPITRPEDRLSVAIESQRADAQENADPAYRAELRMWTTGDDLRNDGVPASAIPYGAAGGHDDVPVRDFDTTGAGELPTETRSGMNQCLMLLGTDTDSREAWLRGGEALERVLLEIARHGYAASPITQLIEMPNTRAMLRQQLRLTMHPHVLLRVGRAPATPATRRRRLIDMLTEVA
jgi:nitroreductase